MTEINRNEDHDLDPAEIDKEWRKGYRDAYEEHEALGTVGDYFPEDDATNPRSDAYVEGWERAVEELTA